MTRTKHRARTAPTCVPPLVVNAASAMREVRPEVCDRLLTDQRMQAVWTELGQHKVTALPADLDYNLRVEHWLGPSAETPSPRDEAAVAFFATVLIQVALGNEARERGEIEDLARRFADAAQMARFARDPFLCPPAADTAALEKAETIFAQISTNFRREARKNHPLIVERIWKKNDNASRSIVRSITKVVESIFGQKLRGTVATATSVAMNTQITPKSV
jgi:hypothetical protein